MSLKLINGIFFSEHKLENIDNEGLINEVTNTYLKGNLNIKGDRPQKNDFTPPLEQTMVHDHAGGIEPFLQLSWVYYPHQPKDAGNICFISTVNESRTHYEVDIKPGHLYLFSPSIMHYVPRNGSGINRISISGNLKSSDKFTQSIKEDSDYESNYWYFVGRDEKLID
mgnify:CR=1 FL=1